jgi:hypothetical protein
VGGVECVERSGSFAGIRPNCAPVALSGFEASTPQLASPVVLCYAFERLRGASCLYRSVCGNELRCPEAILAGLMVA